MQESIIELWPRETESAFAYYNAIYCSAFAVQSAVAAGAMSSGIPVLCSITMGYVFCGAVGYAVMRRIMLMRLD